MAGPATCSDAVRSGGATPTWQQVRRAWRSLERRHWLAAVAVGGALGCAQALHLSATVWDSWPQIKSGLMLTVSVRWASLLMMVACAQLLGMALLHECERSHPVRLRHYLALLAVVAAFGALIANPIAHVLERAVHEAIALPRRAFWADRQGMSLLVSLWTRSVPIIMILSSLTMLLTWYVGKTRRSARALAAAQLHLAEVRRRALAEELLKAQATVDPDFLFDTLNLIEQHYDSEPALALRLLDALIRYLRAALPERDGGTSTAGRQADLVQAYLDIEAIRSGGLLRGRIDVPMDLRPLPMAPLLVLPLVADTVRRAASLAQRHEVVLRSRRELERLVFEIESPSATLPAPESSTLAEVRRRLAALYGPRASLACPARHPGPGVLRLEVDMAEAA